MNKIFETIDVMKIAGEQPQSRSWRPVVGKEFSSLLNHLVTIPEDSKTNLTNESIKILGKCVSPSEDYGGRTGLVLGYVQSGKTLSFTGVSALARDNNYPILIVIAGISIPLSDQSVSRLRKDLRIDDYERTDRSWAQFTNPKEKTDEEAIRRIIENWKDPAVSKADKQTVLITVMKNHTHLKNLIKILGVIDLSKIPTLIVDDEADQASLNTKAQKQGEESTTYAKIMELCRQLPHHTFLQYTATPQAPLLINLIDKLSPTFTEVLTPGQGYIGGKAFFQDHLELVRTIPESEVDNEDNQYPPDSLLFSMQIFFLGVAVGISLGEHQKNNKNRSMLIHPSHHTEPHNQFYRWVTETQKRWEQTFSIDDQDRQDLIEEFRIAYKDLSKTIKDLPKFDKLIEFLPVALRNTTTIKVNSRNPDGRTPTVEWKRSYSHVLIGGQAMDRGFTIEGLTVTYMSRGIGVGNADTLQQRARFFGYKQKYIGYCRIFLDSQMKQAFRDYVDLEEDIRKQLKEYSNNEKPLSEWKRAFFLSDFLNPTRRNVLKDPYTRGRISDKWYFPRVPYGSIESDTQNKQMVDSFINNLDLSQDSGHPNWTTFQRYTFAENYPLKKAYEELLTQFRITNGNDSNYYVGLLLQIKNYLDSHPSEPCSIYVMGQKSPGSEWFKRDRTPEANGRVQLFQGHSSGSKSSRYPGDSEIGEHKNKGIIDIQLYKLRVLKNDTREIIADDLRTLAIWIPNKMAKSWLVK